MNYFGTIHVPSFIIIQSSLNLIQNISLKIIHISDKFIRNVKSRIYGLPINLYKNTCLLEQNCNSFKMWSAIIRINTHKIWPICFRCSILLLVYNRNYQVHHMLCQNNSIQMNKRRTICSKMSATIMTVLSLYYHSHLVACGRNW